MSVIDPVELTRTLIRLQSVNPPGNEAACADCVGELLESGGFRTSFHSFGPGRISVVARKGMEDEAGRPPICLTGHLDTVPLGAAPWSVDPFAGHIIDGRLYGRGSSDMKSGVAAMVVAALNIAERLDTGPGVCLVLTGGEETGCEGANHLATLQGVLGTAGAIVVGEPTGNLPRAGHKGTLWLSAVCQGRTAHGSMPDLGVNAVYRGAAMITKLQAFGFGHGKHDGLGMPTLNVGRMAGGLNINSVPDHAEIGIDIRTVPGMDHETVMEDLHEYLGSDLDSLTPLLDLASVWTSPDEPWLRGVMESFEAGQADAGIGLPFFTDASVLKPAYGDVPTLILGPGETQMAHQTDEYCEVARIYEAVSLYERLMLDWQRREWPVTMGQGDRPVEGTLEGS